MNTLNKITRHKKCALHDYMGHVNVKYITSCKIIL